MDAKVAAKKLEAVCRECANEHDKGFTNTAKTLYKSQAVPLYQALVDWLGSRGDKPDPAWARRAIMTYRQAWAYINTPNQWDD